MFKRIYRIYILELDLEMIITDRNGLEIFCWALPYGPRH